MPSWQQLLPGQGWAHARGRAGHTTAAQRSQALARALLPDTGAGGAQGCPSPGAQLLHRTSELGTVLQLWPSQGRGEGQVKLSCPAAHSPLRAPQQPPGAPSASRALCCAMAEAALPGAAPQQLPPRLPCRRGCPSPAAGLGEVQGAAPGQGGAGKWGWAQSEGTERAQLRPPGANLLLRLGTEERVGDSREREDPAPCSAVTTSGTPQHRKDLDRLGEGQRRPPGGCRTSAMGRG